MPANLEEHKTPTILNEKILITEQLSEMNEKFHMYQSYFSEHPHRLCHAAFIAVHIHQLSTVNSRELHTYRDRTCPYRLCFSPPKAEPLTSEGASKPWLAPNQRCQADQYSFQGCACQRLHGHVKHLRLYLTVVKSFT